MTDSIEDIHINVFFTDGHHKLIHWRLVFHGAVDGFSRTVMFLKCSDNYRAGTVYDLLLHAVGKYVLPSRIRTHQGKENMFVARHIATQGR